MRKIYTSAFLFVLFCSAASAQQYLNQPSLQNMPAAKKATFWDVEKAFNEYWKDKQPAENEGENSEEGGYQQFKRWEWFTKQRTYPTGNFPSPEILFNEYTKFKKSGGYQKGVDPMGAKWSFLGPHVIPTSSGGSGRINCIAFDPSNASTIWTGAACGGLWKSANGGSSWTCNTDLLPSISISDIAIDPSNPQVMYIATGDKYGIYYQYETWGQYSVGVLKSTDGGNTWNQTGMNYSLSNGAVIQRLILDSLSTNTLFAATLAGVFKTTDGGANWTSIKTGKFYDIEFHPTNHSILYAGDSAKVYKTIDGGTTWTQTSIVSSGRNSIAVTRGFPNTVYVWTQNGLSYSSNSGTSFVNRANPSSYCTPYGYYDMVLEVSPISENVLIAGGMEVARSTNGGSAWTKVSSWNSYPATDYVHADHHAIAFAPGSSTVAYACNDGGIFKTSDQCATWSDLSGGIDIKQYYRMASSFLTPTLMYAGAQDNGTDKITGLNTAKRVYGADGEDCLVDFTTDNVVFVSTQSGYFYRSSDGGNTFSSMGANGCDWTSPIAMDPSNHNNMFMGGSTIYKSTNNGVNWNSTGGSFDGSCMYSLEVAPSNSNYVYAATFGHIYRTINGGTNWTNITGTLPVSGVAITGIGISSTNPDNVWVSLSGFNAANKVFVTTNGGTAWTNVSTGIPNIPVNCVEYQKGSNDVVYIGTDLGVFYKDATMGSWVSYNTGLPNVIIDELEVYTPTSKLRAATFGRGIWEIDLKTPILQNLDAGAVTLVTPGLTTCDSVLTPIVKIINSGITPLTSVKLNYKIDAQVIQVYNWSGALATYNTANISLPTYSLTSGTHTLVAYTSNPNLGTDQNIQNDTITNVFIINANPLLVQAPVQEGFVQPVFPPTKWLLENSDNLLARSTITGGFGLSAECSKADFYNNSSGSDMLVSPVIDFQNLSAPIRLYFDVAYSQFGPSYIDSLSVDLYDDCSGVGTMVYKKGGLILSTATSTSNAFVPTSGQWRTDSINLDSKAGQAPARFRFMVRSDNGNNLYLDNINLTGKVVGIAEPAGMQSIVAYPNPSNGIFQLQRTGLKINSMEIYNLLGEKIFSTTNISAQPIDISSCPDGIYFLKVRTDRGDMTQKIVVQH